MNIFVTLRINNNCLKNVIILVALDVNIYYEQKMVHSET